ncbi:hypothetical protein CRUP_030570 [Coryphaenoides rupestris]|nr:hypothetical protein CRUP_030570 [Coryphaenoides rupestris]
MWSIGVLTYVMLTGESPFLGDSKQETFLNISQVNVDYSQDVFEGVSAPALDFIKSLLVKNPRPAASPPGCCCPEGRGLYHSGCAEGRASSYLGGLKAGRPAFSFSGAAYEPAYSSARPEIQQELIC